MPLLNGDHIDYIVKDLHFRGIVLEGLQDEIIDHVCTAVEHEMQRGTRFIDAYQGVLASFGHTEGLRKTQIETFRSENPSIKIMLQNYLRVALRNLSRQRFYSLINISGLAVGVAACLLIALYVLFELSFDRQHIKGDRIYRVNGEIKFGGNHYRLAVAPAPMASALIEEFPEVESAVRFRTLGSYLVRAEAGAETVREHNVVWTDSTFFEIFSCEVIDGNPRTALAEPNSLAVSRSIAEKYFPDGDAMGKSLILDGKINGKITAVFKDMPDNSHFIFDILISLSGLDDAQSPNFLSNNYNTYLLLRPGADPHSVEEKFPDLVTKYIGPQAAQVLGSEFSMEKFLSAGNMLEYTLIPLTDIHLHSDLSVELRPNSDITYVYLFSCIALFILLIGCINFMNLSTARSANRAKEVGVRKVMGSMRSHLVRQFLMESVLLSLFGFALALGLAYFVLPLFNSVAQLNLTIPTSLTFFLIFAGAAIFVGVLAGVYPSFFLSKFEPARVLKGQLALGSRSGAIRGALVVFQFAISIFLIIATITVNKQLNFIQNKKVGFNRDQVIMISDAYALGEKSEAFKSEVLNNSFISSGTISGFIPVSGGYRNDNTFWPAGSPPTKDNMVGMQTWSIDQDYITTMDMKVILGRDFSTKFPSDSSGVILNETAVKHFNLDPDPIGKKITTFSSNNQDDTAGENAVVSYTVIGVVEDFHFESLKQNIAPLGFFLGKSQGYASFRFQAKSTQDVIKKIQEIWQKMAPGQPFQYSFLDESFGRMYASEQRLGKIFGGFAFLAILIASLGLFALSAFTAEQRTKEIGIRKVLGASVTNIIILLSREYGKLILISFIVSAPMAWYAVGWWLENYTYKVQVGLFVYLFAGVGAFLVAWITMSFQSIKAANSNPVKSLRNE